MLFVTFHLFHYFSSLFCFKRGCCVICLSFLSLFLIIILFQEGLLCYLSLFICFIISHHNSVSREAVVLFVIFHLFCYL